MKYILTPDVALRGWLLIPMAYYIRGSGNAHKLSAEEVNLLKKCDGETEISPSAVLDSLLTRGLCTPAENNKKLNDWQRFRFCGNRYFPSANWAITGKCNFNCRHCFNAADNTPLMSEFSWAQCENFIQQMYGCGVQNISLTGGEPMLHPNFSDICREINKRGMVVDEITTNGCFITPEILDEFEKFEVKPLFKLSLDGLGHHDWFRDKKGAEEEVIEKIKLLRSKNFGVRVQTNVHRGNTETILPTAKLVNSLGVESIRVIRTTEAPRWVEKSGGLCLSINEYYDFALDFSRSFIKEKFEMSLDIWQVIQIWPHEKKFHHRPIVGEIDNYRENIPVCRGNRGRIAITPEGEIVPCNQMSGYFLKHGISLGNVHKTPLRELLTSGEYLNHVCYSVGELQKENPQCQACQYWKLCLGGCRAIGILFGGGYKKLDPAKCVYFEHYMDKFDALFGERWNCVDGDN